MTASAKTRVVVWGVGGHALVVADILRQLPDYALEGFLIDAANSAFTRETLRPLLLGGAECLDRLREAGVVNAVVAIGDCKTRLEAGAMLQSNGFNLAVVIHPKAILADDTRIGAGTVITASAIVSPGVIVGENVIINTGATVDHECRLADGVHVSPGAHLAGRVVVERGSWIGIGANVIDGIRIGANSIIGAGSAVVRHIPDNVVAYGVPAKVMKENNSGL